MERILTTVKQALSGWDAAAPSLGYLGLACWMAWNSIAFSGSFWLFESDSNYIGESLKYYHLASCVATLVVFSVLQKYTKRLVGRTWFTWLGAAVSCTGTAFICIAREGLLQSETLFTTGCILAGAGTTVLFLRAVPLYSMLPPSRSLFRLASCNLLNIAIYFMLDSAPNPVGIAVFVALPAAAAALYSLKFEDKPPAARPEQHELHAPLFAVLLLSLGICSTAFELAAANILIDNDPSLSVSTSTYAHLIEAPLMLLLMAYLHFGKHRREAYGALYSVIASCLAVLLIAVVVLSLPTPAIASAMQLICGCYNIVAWGLLYYLAFQAQERALTIVGLGNAVISAGTFIGSFVIINLFGGKISDDVMSYLAPALGLVVLVDVLFVFSDRQINQMLKPVDESAFAPAQAAPEPVSHKRVWMEKCERVAREAGLSEKETLVLIDLARGKTAQEIADKNVVSIYTVRAHTRSIYAKLDVHSRKELSDYIKEHGGE